jgi:hypothetical protein
MPKANAAIKAAIAARSRFSLDLALRPAAEFGEAYGLVRRRLQLEIRRLRPGLERSVG